MKSSYEWRIRSLLSLNLRSIRLVRFDRFTHINYNEFDKFIQYAIIITDINSNEKD